VVIANRITGAVGILRDITAIKRTQQGIIRSEANLKAVISSLDDIIFQINKEHHIENVWTSDHYAFTNVGELVGKSVAPFFYQASHQVTAAIDIVFATHKPQSIEFYIEQMRRWYRAKIMYVMISGKETATVLLADITNRKQYEQEILHLNDRLTQLNENLEDRVAERTQDLENITSALQREVRVRTHAEERLSAALEREHLFSEMKTRLVTLLSHQFRTPLTYIQSGADIIEHGMRGGKILPPEQISKHLESVHIGTEQIVHLIDNVARLMDVQTAILQDVPRLFNLTELVQSIVKEFNYSDDLHRLDAIERVRISAPAALHTHVSELAVRTAVHELLKNALTYAPIKSQIVVAIAHAPHDTVDADADMNTLAEHDNASSAIHVAITNSGSSIAPNEVESVFEYFYRSGEHAAVGKSRALGIGLGLVKFCAEALRGNILLETSAATKETTFTLVFPQSNM
jgi:signal transduction histidine kinase